MSGNILLAAYYSPITLQELSVELGVAAAYLEDELTLLQKRQYLTEKAGKYQTNIPIFTTDCQETIEKKLADGAQNAAGELIALLKQEADGLPPALKRLFSEPPLAFWQIFTLVSHLALLQNNDLVEKLCGGLPADGPYAMVNGGGGLGLVWGRAGGQKRKYNGIYQSAKPGGGQLAAYNFVQIEAAQHVQTHMIDALFTAAAVSSKKPDGTAPSEKDRRWLSDLHFTENGWAVFPVFSQEQYALLSEQLAKSVGAVAAYCQYAAQLAMDTTTDHAPPAVRSAARHVSAIVCQNDGLYYLVDALMKEGFLPVPDPSDKPALFAVTG